MRCCLFVVKFLFVCAFGWFVWWLFDGALLLCVICGLGGLVARLVCLVCVI